MSLKRPRKDVVLSRSELALLVDLVDMKIGMICELPRWLSNLGQHSGRSNAVTNPGLALYFPHFWH